jgi:hypothetical protein
VRTDLFAQPVEVFGPGTISKDGESVYRGSFSPDGGAFYFFRKVTQGAEDYRIFVSRRTEAGWSDPERLVLGREGTSDLYPAVSSDGRYLVFSSYRAAGGEYDLHPNANLWMAPRSDDGWGEPRLLEGLSTPGNYHPGPAFDPWGRLRFKSTTRDWNRTMHRIADFEDGSFGEYGSDSTLDPWSGWRDGEVYVWDGVASPDGQMMLLDVSEIGADGRRGPTDQWVSLRSGDEWTDPVRLGPEVNTDAYENFAVFSPDGEFVHFVRAFSTYYRMRVEDVVDFVREAREG